MTSMNCWRAWLCFLAVLVAHSRFSLAAEPLEQLLIRARGSSGDLSHIDGAVYLRGNQPLLAFGVVKLPEGKPQYSYMVLFKTLKNQDEEFSVTGPLRSGSFQTKYTVQIGVGKRRIDIAHHFAIDRESKQVKTDTLTIGDKEVKPDTSRFFVVDLNCDPPSWQAIDRKMPVKVFAPDKDEPMLDDVRALTKTLQEEVKELRE